MPRLLPSGTSAGNCFLRYVHRALTGFMQRCSKYSYRQPRHEALDVNFNLIFIIAVVVLVTVIIL